MTKIRHSGYNLPSYADDPIGLLPCGDELAAELARAIEDRLARGERHVHMKRGTCEVCAAAAADTVVRYLEANTRVCRSDALDDDAHGRAVRAIKAMPYLGTGLRLRLTCELGNDPAYPTVEDLLVDLETIRVGLVALFEREREREGELRTYRKWRSAVAALASEIVEQFDGLDTVEVQP